MAFFRIIGYRAGGAFLPLVVALNGIGLLTLQSVAPALVIRQTLFGILGLALWCGLALSEIWQQLRHLRYICGVGTLVLLVVTALWGERVGGAKAWLKIGGLQFQPSEPGKLLLVVFLAGILVDLTKARATPTQSSRKEANVFPYLGPAVAVWTIAMLTLVAQRDLGAAILFTGILVLMLVTALGSWWYLAWAALAGLAGSWAAVRFFDHVKVRFSTWINPWIDPTGRGYQLIQGLYGLAAGGITGVGPGRGMAHVVPAVGTDFILVAIAEEWGLAGILVLLCCFLLLLWQGLHTALTTESEFGRLLAVGLAGMLWLQVILVGGGITRLIPLTGITTPFVSYGGTSLVTNYAVVGLLANISHSAALDGESTASPERKAEMVYG